MKLFQALSAVLLGSGALSLGLGCLAEAEDLDMTADEDVPATPLTLGGPKGSTGTNNLPPPDMQNHRTAVYGATGSALAALNMNNHNWEVALNPSTTTLLAGEEGRRVLKYVSRCAVDETVTLHAQVGATAYTFPGQGILSTTQGWLSGGLPLAGAQDVFSCLLAHMNARGVQVPINLSGPSVTNTDGADANFDWEEALWVTRIVPATATTKLRFDFYVWPLDDLLACTEYASQVRDRICGLYSGTCGATVRTDRSNACTELTDGWYCTPVPGVTLPAIKTRLKVTDVDIMYDNCP
jgi:hypothetical protein